MTKILLKKDFNIDWDIPENHLCPGITGHINYINELYDILKADLGNENKNLKGIDVGTGASCIYPLLGRSLYNWNFIATDIDPESIENARKIIENNNLTNSILCIQRKQEDPLIKDLIDSSIHFVMCNPPFFNSLEEV